MARLLILSDIHGNIYSLKTIWRNASRWDEVIVLGDLVDYAPYPSEVIDFLREHGARIVRGNHDQAVAYGVDCRCGEETHWLSVWFRENITLKLLNKDHKMFLKNLPLNITLKTGSITLHAVHAAPSNPLYAYLYPWLSNEEVCKLLRKPFSKYKLSTGDKVHCPKGLYLIGHTHYQFYRVVDGTLVVNPGSAGAPRDGDPRVSYIILDTDKESIEFYRVKYSIENIVRAFEELKIPEPYLSALKYMFKYGKTPPKPS